MIQFDIENTFYFPEWNLITTMKGVAVLKVFDLHWRDGVVNRIKGDSIEDAARCAGYGGGAFRALDYWEEIKELPLKEKYLLDGSGEICNPEFIEQIHQQKDIEVGSEIKVKLMAYDFVLTVVEINSLFIRFKTRMVKNQ